MLKTLGVLHTPDLLHTLASMGHGDDIAFVDANYPAASQAARLVRLDGADLPGAIAACLQLMPLDSFATEPALRMLQVHSPAEIPEVQELCQKVIDTYETSAIHLVGIPREAFYERARSAYAIVVTGERRLYGCVLLKKGVLPPTAS